MFSRREIGLHTHVYQNFTFKLCVVMVLAPTRHPRNGFSRELENCQGGRYPQLLAKFNVNTPKKRSGLFQIRWAPCSSRGDRTSVMIHSNRNFVNRLNNEEYTLQKRKNLKEKL